MIPWGTVLNLDAIEKLFFFLITVWNSYLPQLLISSHISVSYSLESWWYCVHIKTHILCMLCFMNFLTILNIASYQPPSHHYTANFNELSKAIYKISVIKLLGSLYWTRDNQGRQFCLHTLQWQLWVIETLARAKCLMQ